FDRARQLSEAYPQQKEVQLEIAKLLAAYPVHAFEQKDYQAALGRLQLLEKTFPNTPETEKIRGLLRDKANALFEEAQALRDQGKADEAIAKLQTAETIYPFLPKLKDTRLRWNKEYPILFVGVAELPRYLDPARAYTDSEKQAVELLFEGLVKLAPYGHRGFRYEPGLAEPPQLLPMG